MKIWRSLEEAKQQHLLPSFPRAAGAAARVELLLTFFLKELLTREPISAGCDGSIFFHQEPDLKPFIPFAPAEEHKMFKHG